MATFSYDSLPTYDSSDLSTTVKKLYNYAIELADQLAWVFSNLDEDNVTSLSGLMEQVSDAEGNISELTQSAAGILTRVENAEGDVFALTQTAEGLSARVESAEGDLTAVVVTANALQSQISSVEGNISTLTQTDELLSSRITNSEGDISTLTQSVNGFSLSVDNDDDSSTIALCSNGVEIDSATIKFKGNVVFESDLEEGTTEINGSCIKTGTLSADCIEGGELRIGSGSSYSTMNVYASSKHMGGVGADSTGVEFYANGISSLVGSTHAKVTAQTGNVYISAADGGSVQIYSRGTWVTI